MAQSDPDEWIWQHTLVLLSQINNKESENLKEREELFGRWNSGNSDQLLYFGWLLMQWLLIKLRRIS